MIGPYAKNHDPAAPEHYKDNLRTEYDALTRYFTTVIRFRFTTAAFFITAVGLIVGLKDDAKASHHVLLFLFALGVWIVELRHRSLWRQLLTRGAQIECEWGYPRGIKGYWWAFLGHTTPETSRARLPTGVERPAEAPSETKILWFKVPSPKAISHTLGLDIVYLSTMGYALWRLLMPLASESVSEAVLKYQTGVGFLMLIALIGFGFVCLGFWLIAQARLGAGGQNGGDDAFAQTLYRHGSLISIAGVVMTASCLVTLWVWVWGCG